MLQLRLLAWPCFLCLCCLPKDMGIATRPSHPPFSPFCVFNFPSVPEIPVRPTTVAGAEKGLLGYILDAPVLTCFGET